MSSIRFTLALLAGKLARAGVNLIAPERGTNLPGAVALKICPTFLQQVRGLTARKVIAVTGTNGKSTTNNLITHILRSSGYSVAANLEGANMVGGVATTLLDNVSLRGTLRTDWVCLEVDERSLPAVAQALPIGTFTVTNVQKDQVQRNGEPDYIMGKIRKALDPQLSASDDLTLVLNDDEPYARSLTSSGYRTVFYAVAPNRRSRSSEGPWAVTMGCPSCGEGRIRFQTLNASNIGPFRCTKCDFASRSGECVVLEDVDFDSATFTDSGSRYQMPYTQSFFTYSYSAAIAVAKHLGIESEKVKAGLASFVNVAGRTASFEYAGKTVHYLRIKQENPDTLQSAFDAIAAAPGTGKTLVLGLCELTDFQPYYTNTFYVYDTDVNVLPNGGVDEAICFSTYVGVDTAVALEYGGFAPEQIRVLDTEDVDKVLRAMEEAKNDDIYLITWLGWYNKLKAETERRAR
ncbi:MAG: MurT ligase domain-containing protein [Actinomycetaceae bacterium]|nr:MurT ligase domain-containing protein [Actinomycetaceae bacterium]